MKTDNLCRRCQKSITLRGLRLAIESAHKAGRNTSPVNDDRPWAGTAVAEVFIEMVLGSLESGECLRCAISGLIGHESDLHGDIKEHVKNVMFTAIENA